MKELNYAKENYRKASVELLVYSTRYSKHEGVCFVRNLKNKLQFSEGHILGNRMLKIIGKLSAWLLGNLLICFVVYMLYKRVHILMQGTDVFYGKH